MQGFQCASPEMTTAKLAYQNKDFVKAKTYLNKELDRNPKNTEANIIYAEISQKEANLEEAIKHINAAENSAVDEKTKTQVQLFKNQLWIKLHDDGVELLNKFFETQSESLLDEAINKLTLGKEIKPEMPNFFNYLGNAYEAKGDTAKAMDFYNQYFKLVEPGIELARAKGIYNGMLREEALKSLGAPKSSQGFKTTTDSIIIEKYAFSIGDEFAKSGNQSGANGIKSGLENEIFTFYVGNAAKMTLYGWKVDPPKKWLDNEREQPATISSAPIASLSQYYFDKKEYDKSLKYATSIIVLEPNNVDANNFLFQIYELQGKKDAAIKYLDLLISKNPENKNYRTQYGDYFLKEKNNDKAIAQYEIALKTDPEFPYALINAASAYKNKAKEIQDKQEDMFAKDPKYKRNMDEYKTVLIKSSEYFEKCLKTSKFQNNYQVLYELVEIYHVMDMNEKRDQKIREMENVEAVVDPTEKKTYYLKLIKIFDSLVKNPDKMNTYNTKYNALN